MHIVQVLLPIYDNDGQVFEQALYLDVNTAFTERCDGVTAYVHSPAEGAWQGPSGAKRHDEIVIFCHAAKLATLKRIKGIARLVNTIDRELLFDGGVECASGCLVGFTFFLMVHPDFSQAAPIEREGAIGINGENRVVIHDGGRRFTELQMDESARYPDVEDCSSEW